MKVRVWNVICDNGDGSSSIRNFKSKEALIEYFKEDADEDYELNEDEVYDGATIFDQYDYAVEVSVQIFDTEGYEVVE